MRPIEQIADGLQRLIAETAEQAAEKTAERVAEKTAERAAEKAVARLEPRLDRMDARIDGLERHMNTRLDRQDDTLRLMWKQMKGNGKLPIDD